MPYGQAYVWIPDLLIGLACLGIALTCWLLARAIRLPFSPAFFAFGLFIGLCGLTHGMAAWNLWRADGWSDDLLKYLTAAASLVAAAGMFRVRSRLKQAVDAARLSEQRRICLDNSNAERDALYEKLRQLDASKARFFNSVAHELRTPLSLILGPAERMLGDAGLDDDQRRQLAGISRNGKALLKQVDALLDSARVEAGTMPVRYARLDLVRWFRQVAPQFEIVAQQRAIRYRIAAPAALQAQADADLLERVFVGLLANAFRRTHDGGEIHAELAAEWGAFRLTVADSGPAAGPDRRSAMFAHFHPAADGDTRAQGDGGPGLAIVRDLVELLHGRIDVGASPSGGSAFVVRLPLSAPPGTAQQESAGAPGTAQRAARPALAGALHELLAPPAAAMPVPPLRELPGRPRVLVVADHADMCAFLATTLNADYNIAVAASGAEGLDRAQALRPDLLVADLALPGIGGDQLVCALRQCREFDSMPVLLLTVPGDDELRVKLPQHGAQDYLVKPFRPRELQVRAAGLIAIKRAGDTLRRDLACLSLDLESLAAEISGKHRQLQAAAAAADAARAQAERASQVKSHFLMLVSHEMRAPLSTIHMNLERLADRQAGAAPEQRALGLAQMFKAAQQMEALVEGLLEYARIESGRIDARCDTVDAMELAGEVMDAHRDNAAPGVRLVLAPPAEHLPAIVSDARLLRVVLSNLVSNALKFTEQGTVTLRVGSSGVGHVFEVHDTGIGIPEEDIPRLFQPFEQFEPAQRHRIPGVGLGFGLALAKRIVEALHGRLDVRSTLGAGSSFTVWVPQDMARGAES